MSTPVLVGREATHGTVTASFVSGAVNFDPKLVVANVVPDEQRNSQDAQFAVIPGQKHLTWSIADSPVYHDTFGYWLDGAIGLPVSTLAETGVYDSVYKFTDDPPSLSLKWVQPKRVVQAYQSLWGVVDKLTVTFDAAGQLMFSAEGFAMGETEVTTPTFTFSTAIPMTAWEGTVNLGGGAFTRLVSGSVAITRNRSPFRTINNTADPIDFAIGNRIVEYDLVLDFNSKTEYDRYKTGATTALTITWEDADVLIGSTKHPKFILKLGTIGYVEGEIDTGASFPALNVRGRGLYNGTDASSVVYTLTSTRQYQTA